MVAAGFSILVVQTAIVRQDFADTTGPGLLVALVLAIVAAILLYATKRQELANFVAARAPRLPIRALSEHDDAWIAGTVVHDEPLSCPWFGTPCVYYTYRIEHLVTRVVRDSKGRTRTVTSWETEYSERDSCDFEIRDDTGTIAITAHEATFERLPGTGYDYAGFSRRHVATMLPVGIEVHSLGVKVEGDRFAPLDRVPLIITTVTSDDYVRGGDRSEAVMRWFGSFVGLAALVIAASMIGVPTWQHANWYRGIPIGIVAWLPLWLWSSYNRFVRQRETTEAAWRQIDVDLDVRYQVVPKVAEVARAYAEHEQELFEALARLRNESSRSREETIRNERVRSRTVRRLLALAESYPKLRANELFARLHEKLWALEEKIAASRSFYDRTALEWNRLVEGFPSMFVAKLFGFERREYFGAMERERDATKVVL
ncbi:MAG: LemA family protein [Planctomycetes bacterium]|nr:LemA family protein [Planctomycetota bacterium]MCB9919884.1 LemA family protein [Planctomycetota bacterium]